MFSPSLHKACRWAGINWTLMSYCSPTPGDDFIKSRLVELAHKPRRYGLLRLLSLLRKDGIKDNHKRIARIYRPAALQVPTRRRRKLALGRGAPKHAAITVNHRWSLDFVNDRLPSVRSFRTLNVNDYFTRETLAIEVDFSFPSERVIRVLDRVAMFQGYPVELIVDNGAEFRSLAMRRSAMEKIWIHSISPGKPTRNAFIELEWEVP